ncbi:MULTISPECIES: hypothetical protein [Bradyrhizobium]|uniref:Uncharacterized protein n=1 Tax=Bradyrhizobium ottawaense TaxID=931866 RepID=A0ABV4FVB0_9BRAD|nr:MULTISPECIES: hypothetical protein [Bradyrhizobium]MBR1294837.1 hypothetical protein [Bradyrhizobium ottawaense]WLB47296.1 hypothetical protein QIH93_04270 [Bradyrhizobium ottawaense]WQN84619.1 hypothetical protein U7859_09190 [Bradyrhizobium ottawaense]BBO08495.1 hypothetical protein SG09_78450 [Bradyrhizobium ottawaense]GMO42338.1 hypothetical protein BwSF21_54620 [Bradyrhizobium ottawaense]
MATLSQLVAGIAAVEGIDAERVGAIARAVREEGLIKTSGRGPSAAQMDECDAANLLIAVNTADTARTAPGVVKQYRALQARRDRTSEFGSEFEELLSAAKAELLADYATKVVSLLGTRRHILGKRHYPNEAYEFSITFEKPVPSVLLHVGASRAKPHFISFYDRQELTIKTAGDRRESTTITQRTIFAVADVLRI